MVMGYLADCKRTCRVAAEEESALTLCQAKEFFMRFRWILVAIGRFIGRLRYACRFFEIWHYECESCNRCGRCYQLVAHWTNEKWLAVNGQEAGCLCVECFIEQAQKLQLPITISDIERLWIFQENVNSFDIISKDD
jgi:hypothetical protein